MQITTTDADIPKYAFEPDLTTGNPLFRIDKIDSAVNYIKADFLSPHRKDYYFMAFVKKGCNRHWIDMTPYVLKPNTFYFTVPHQVHLKEASEPMTGISISFREEFLALDESRSLKELPVIQNPFNGHELTLTETDLLFIEDLLERIHNEFHARNKWQQGMLLGYMRVLLIYLSRLYMEQFSNEDAIPEKILLKKYLQNINTHFTNTHEIADYASMMNISAGHLSEVIKEQSGKPPITHLHERLMLEARRLLFHTGLSVKEIAFQLGFEDDSYFNRFFKRLAGETPVAYRTSTRKMYH
jgi:AraC family transcriptional activator of pobA